MLTPITLTSSPHQEHSPGDSDNPEDLKGLQSCFSLPSPFRQVNVLPFRKSVIYFLPEDFRDSEIVPLPLVPLAGLGQDVLIANQNFSCFNLSPFPCVCYSLALPWADLGVGRQPEPTVALSQGFLQCHGTVSPLTVPIGSRAGQDAGRKDCQAGVQVWTTGRSRGFGSHT